MTSRNTPLGVSASKTMPFLDSIRRQIARIPPARDAAEALASHRGEIDYFSAARIYVTYKVKLAEHFPEEIPADTFDFLVDLTIQEWLGRRMGAAQPGHFGVPRAAALSPRIQHAASLGFVTIAPDPDDDGLRIISLTASARTRINNFFDYMASYITVL